MQAIEENKSLLKEKYGLAKVMGERVNQVRGSRNGTRGRGSVLGVEDRYRSRSTGLGTERDPTRFREQVGLGLARVGSVRWVEGRLRDLPRLPVQVLGVGVEIRVGVRGRLGETATLASLDNVIPASGGD